MERSPRSVGTLRIAIDAMGGDAAPREIVRGALEAMAKDPSLQIILVGDESRVRKEMEGHPAAAAVKVVHASEVIEPKEHPVESLRRKPGASILKAVHLVRDGFADAAISAGHTGAAVAAGQLSLRLIPGVQKPGIPIPVPTLKGRCTLIDVGANIYARPTHLYQYALMATIYCACLYGIERPTVGLLSIGEEQEKGNELVHGTFPLLSKSDIRFLGNVEGRDLFTGKVDIVVCDGFVGNIVLKVIEGYGESLYGSLQGALQASSGNGNHPNLAPIECLLRDLASRWDYEEVGGAPLLGVDGLLFISHGRSTSKAIRNAIRTVQTFEREGLTRRIQDIIEKHPITEVLA